jgi:hypothetical protein
MLNRKSQNTQNSKHKCAQASLPFNIAIGIIFIFIAFGLFLFSNYMIEGLKEDSINEVQQSDLVLTYTGALQKMNVILLEDFLELDVRLDESPEYFSEVTTFATFQDQVLTASKEDKNSKFCPSYDAQEKKRSVVFVINTQIHSYGVCNFFKDAPKGDFYNTMKEVIQ